MSEYSWYVKQIWFGVEGPKPDREMIGIIKRSGQCRALGHFCHVKISVNGKKVWASGAEDRTFYMHLVTWEDIGRYIPQGLIPALGWCKEGKMYCLLHEGMIVTAAGQGSLHPVPEDVWQDEWKHKPITLIEKGACVAKKNYYIALLDTPTEKGEYRPRGPKPRVTLPYGRFDVEKKEFEGLTGAVSMWNGPPPPWCKQVVQVYQSKTTGGWIHLKDEEVTELWRRS